MITKCGISRNLHRGIERAAGIGRHRSQQHGPRVQRQPVRGVRLGPLTRNGKLIALRCSRSPFTGGITGGFPHALDTRHLRNTIHESEWKGTRRNVETFTVYHEGVHSRTSGKRREVTHNQTIVAGLNVLFRGYNIMIRIKPLQRVETIRDEITCHNEGSCVQTRINPHKRGGRFQHGDLLIAIRVAPGIRNRQLQHILARGQIGRNDDSTTRFLCPVAIRVERHRSQTPPRAAGLRI